MKIQKTPQFVLFYGNNRKVQIKIYAGLKPTFVVK